MKFFEVKKQLKLLSNFQRRMGWFLENPSPRKLSNLGVAGLHYAAKTETTLAWPVVLKIDISPLCNLHCTVCVHAYPNGNKALENQYFHKRQMMTVEEYRRIIDEVKGKTAAVSLYYLGDPYMHPDVDEMCRIARDAGINVHINSNFSYNFSEERLKKIVTSGLTHLTVCVDGLSQEKYQRTRVGGRIEKVIENLKKVIELKKKYGQIYPKIEVQYIKFQHNVDELEEAMKMFQELGVEQTSSFWGSLANYTDFDPGTYDVFGPKKKKSLPHCFWPYFAMVIKYNGDVIPCCTYRLGQQYTREESCSKILGNVFESGVKKIWDSPEYRQIRRFVSNPEIVNSDPSFKDHFCYGCPSLFHTNREDNERRADKYTFEEIYELNEKGRPVRKGK